MTSEPNPIEGAIAALEDGMGMAARVEVWADCFDQSDLDAIKEAEAAQAAIETALSRLKALRVETRWAEVTDGVLGRHLLESPRLASSSYEFVKQLTGKDVEVVPVLVLREPSGEGK